MKKYLPATILLILIVPSIASAAWWNPLSWFNNWNFRQEKIMQSIDTPADKSTNSTADEIEKLKTQIKELESKQSTPTVSNAPEVKKSSPVNTPVTNTTPTAVDEKQIKLNEINKQIADLNAKYAQDVADINKDGGRTLATIETVRRAIEIKYINDYNLLVAKYQQIQYSN